MLIMLDSSKKLMMSVQNSEVCLSLIHSVSKSCRFSLIRKALTVCSLIYILQSYKDSLPWRLLPWRSALDWFSISFATLILVDLLCTLSSEPESLDSLKDSAISFGLVRSLLIKVNRYSSWSSDGGPSKHIERRWSMHVVGESSISLEIWDMGPSDEICWQNMWPK